MIYGVLMIAACVAIAIGGYRLRQKLFGGWDDTPRIGAIDMLFSLKGLLSVFLYMVFHLLWFTMTFTALILGIVYLTQ
jgi:hypothetical protein